MENKNQKKPSGTQPLPEMGMHPPGATQPGMGLKSGMEAQSGMGMMNGESGPERILAFSDGVFAILITIMILELKKPEAPTFAALFKLWPTWLSYSVSYLFIAIVWINHHFLMKFAQVAKPKLMWANFAHLFCVAVIPFFTEWLADTKFAPIPVAMYGFDFILVNITYLWLVWETLCDETARATTLNARSLIHLRFVITLGMFVVAAVVAFWFPFVSFGLIVVCLLLYSRPEVPRIFKALNIQMDPMMMPHEKMVKQ